MKNTPTFDTSRRNFLAAAASAAGILGVVPLAAGQTQDPRTVLDAAVLNFLIRIEDVQAELYREGVNDFLTTSARRRLFDPFGGQATLDTLLSFHEQELAHGATLRDLVARLGATPQPRCSVNFPRFDTPPDFLSTALTIEDLAVSAYLGVIPLLRNPLLQSAVASLSSVESRHAAYVGLLNGQSPAPLPADTPRSRREILRLLDPVIGQCATL